MSAQSPAATGPGQADAAIPDGHLDRARSGDLVAFRELLRAHQARVFSLALRLLGQRGDAEEVAQDVFLQLHGALPQITSAAHLKHWLLRTVSHRCIDRLRSAGSRPQLVPMDALPAGVEPAAPEKGYDPLVAAQVHRLVLQLAPEARAVLVLRFQEDLDPSDIATALAMSINTVKSHLRRSLEQLRAQMGDQHES
jgi:RNA polymerase sigma-70 factor (ECF subfamily)